MTTLQKMITKYKEKDIPELEVGPLTKEIRDKYNLLIGSSGIGGFSSKFEVWTSSGTNKTLAYFSHGIFRYFGKFPPPIARYLIQQYTKEHDLVIDPMCGSGTTALEALLLNRKAKCYDINPLSVLISKVKVTKLDQTEFKKALDKVIANSKGNKNITANLVGLKNPEHWFLPETIRSLAGIKKAIKDLKTKSEIKDSLLLALLAIVRRVSRATTQQGRLFLDVVTAEKDALPFFEKRAKEIIEAVSQLPSNDSIEIFQKSILDNTRNESDPAELIICHPPYFNAYKYSGVNSLELSWLGVDHAEIRKNEIREAFKVGKAEKVKEYIIDMKQALKNLSAYLRQDGRLALMIGDTVIKGSYIPVTQMLLNELKDTFVVEKAALRIPQFTEASWAASQRRTGNQVGINLCDLIVILRKK